MFASPLMHPMHTCIPILPCTMHHAWELSCVHALMHATHAQFPEFVAATVNAAVLEQGDLMMRAFKVGWVPCLASPAAPALLMPLDCCGLCC